MTGSDTDDGPVAYWPPDPRLARYVTGYHRFRVAMPPGQVLNDIFFPGWSNIRFAIEDSERWALRMGSRTYDPVPEIAYIGPTSYAGYCRATRGTLTGFGILPAGWARLFGGNVSRYANRVAPLETIIDDAPELREALASTSSLAATFDAWLLERLAAMPEEDPIVERIFRLIDDPAIIRIETMAEMLGVTSRALAAVTKANFGFTPKLLLRRGRFLRALSAALASEGGQWSDVLEAAGYWDRSHFLRDSHLFLGCSIRDFMARRGPMNAMALQVRRECSARLFDGSIVEHAIVEHAEQQGRSV